MSSRYARVIIIAEDELSANLLRNYALRALDIDIRRVRQLIAPAGGGDAKRWILSQYPVETKELRRGLTHNCLIVHIDADTDTVATRQQELSEAMRIAGQLRRESDERISHVIPKRHTETWLCVLTGHHVDEADDCKRRRILSNPYTAVKPAAEALYASTRPSASPPPLPSMISAVPELRRLER
jgi:hypothetical protein